jgi:hypothetical protein
VDFRMDGDVAVVSVSAGQTYEVTFRSARTP